MKEHEVMGNLPSQMFVLEQRFDLIEGILKRWEEDVMRNSMAIKLLEKQISQFSDLMTEQQEATASKLDQFLHMKSRLLIMEKKLNEL